MTARPHEKDDEPEAEPLDPELVRRIRKSLDPHPSIPAKEAFARVDACIAEHKAKRGL